MSKNSGENKSLKKKGGKRSKDKFFRKSLLFEKRAEMKTGDYTLEELKAVIKKMKKNKSPGARRN